MFPPPALPQRKIIHVDMDAFYASVEQRDNPDLRGQPVAVGSASKRGVVAAASYEARKFGVRSAMPSVTAQRTCPHLIFVRPRFDVYRQVSNQIREIFREVADAVEPLSLDEAYLDVTNDKGDFGSATAMARHIRKRIFDVTGLTASAGVSTNKLVAKLASDHDKPDGLTVVPPGQEAAFVQILAVRRLHGVGPVTAARLEAMGLYSVASLANCSREVLAKEFRSSSVDWLIAMANGCDDREVREDRIRKSLGAERTFADDLLDAADLHAALALIVDLVWERAQKSGDGAAKTVTLKLKFADFRQITRAHTLTGCPNSGSVNDHATLLRLCCELLENELPAPLGIRLMGVTLSGFGRAESNDGGDGVATLPLFAQTG